jgi:hypothetical protein
MTGLEQLSLGAADQELTVTIVGDDPPAPGTQVRGTRPQGSRAPVSRHPG